jgi:hypothetical protein
MAPKRAREGTSPIVQEVEKKGKRAIVEMAIKGMRL